MLETGEEFALKPILMCIMDNFDKFVKDSYGNYVIQYILERSSKYSKEKTDATICIITKMDDYCLEKYASNVVEKCLKNANPTDLELLIKAMCSNS
jgi:pumilio RNA-binding family